MPLFSIITPVYNNERYIRNAVNSVLEQDFQDYEYIIVDDGSTDHTSQIVDDIAKTNHKVHVIHQKNQWIYASFNNGIRTAKGEYIYILNSDDRMRKGALRKMKNIISEYAPDVVWTKVLVHKCDKNQYVTEYDYFHLDKQIQRDMFFSSSQEVRKNWLFLTVHNLNQNQANLYKRELMMKHLFRNDVYGADVLFNTSLANDICTAFVMKDAVYDFFEYDDQSMNVSIGKYYPYLNKMFDEIYLNNITLYRSWNLYTDEAKEYWGRRRIGEVTTEMNVMMYPQCTLTTEEKIEKALKIFEDETVYQCALQTGYLEEFESRILSGIRKILLREYLQSDSKMFFVYELLDSLLRYEKTTQDYEKIERAVFHQLNKNHLGKSFYNKLERKN